MTVLGSIGLCVVYVQGGNTQYAGLCWGAAFLGLGVGMILWARDLMPGNEVIASRGHHDVCAEADRLAVTESFDRGTEPMARRPFLLMMLGGVAAVFGLASIFPLASLGPRPHDDLDKTDWAKGARALSEDGTPIKPGDIPVNGIITVFPEVDEPSTDALSPTLLINVGDAPFEIPQERVGWNIGGLVAFSKICTHAGCPASLYNVLTHQLICPCHQSTFDVLEDCKPVLDRRRGRCPSWPSPPTPRRTWWPRAPTTSPLARASGTEGRGGQPMSTTEERASAQKRFSITKSGFDTIDERFGSSRFLTSVLDKIFPDHWSFMVGEIAMDSLIILIPTGVYLTFF